MLHLYIYHDFLFSEKALLPDEHPLAKQLFNNITSHSKPLREVHKGVDNYPE
jgi:hypothetical protein